MGLKSCWVPEKETQILTTPKCFHQICSTGRANSLTCQTLLLKSVSGFINVISNSWIHVVAQSWERTDSRRSNFQIFGCVIDNPCKFEKQKCLLQDYHSSNGSSILECRHFLTFEAVELKFCSFYSTQGMKAKTCFMLQSTGQ